VVSPGGKESVVPMDFTRTGGRKVRGGRWAEASDLSHGRWRSDPKEQALYNPERGSMNPPHHRLGIARILAFNHLDSLPAFVHRQSLKCNKPYHFDDLFQARFSPNTTSGERQQSTGASEATFSSDDPKSVTLQEGPLGRDIYQEVGEASLGHGGWNLTPLGENFPSYTLKASEVLLCTEDYGCRAWDLWLAGCWRLRTPVTSVSRIDMS
jgi:hypothetical protein